MKRCPICKNDYDDAVAFCEIDGHALANLSDAEAEKASAATTPLSGLINTQAPFEPERAVWLAILICDAVERLHHSGKVIGSLCPQDILVSTDETGKERLYLVAPKGGADQYARNERMREAADNVSPESAMREASGTGYASPETAQKDIIDVRADVYSIGAILYEMLTGRAPFKASSPAAVVVKQLLENPRPLRDFQPDIPEKLQRVVLRALEKEKADRQQSCAEFRKDLEAATAKSDSEYPGLDKNTPLQMSAIVEIDQASDAETEYRVCPLCSYKNAPADTFCKKCSTQLISDRPLGETNCPRCGYTNQPDSLFCFACGSQMTMTRTRGEGMVSAGPGDAPASAPSPAVPRSAPAPSMPTGAFSPATASAAPRTLRKAVYVVIFGVAILSVAGILVLLLSRSTSINPSIPPQQSSSNSNIGIKSNSNIGTEPEPAPSGSVSNSNVGAEPASPNGSVSIVLLVTLVALGMGGLAVFFWLLLRRRPPVQKSRPVIEGREQAVHPEPTATLPAPHPEVRLPAPPPEAMPVEQRFPTMVSESVSARAGQEDAETVRVPQPRQAPSQESIKRCPSCGTEFPVSARFCVHDGTALKEEVKTIPEKKGPSFYDLQSVEIRKQCPKCGEDYPPNKKFCRFDGQPLIEVKKPRESDEQPDEMEPIVIGQYSCFARLGEGGMGVVYKARHVHLDRLSAVKVLLPQMTALLPDAVQMFRREARLASSITHPNIVLIYDYGELDKKLFYLAMEFLLGKSLAEIIEPPGQTSRPLPLQRTVDITRQICEALDAAHQTGIVHRDLKPQNVMICKKSNGADLVKVVDFGIARSLRGYSDYQTTPGAIIGTPAYMSPEQATGLPDIDARSDIYSLGLMVYEMLCGRPPFQSGKLTPMQQAIRRAQMTAPPAPLSSSHPELRIPAEIDQVLMHALEPNRNRRTQSINQFIYEMEKATNY